eukprot:2209442-Prymnesium_polylepis.1
MAAASLPPAPPTMAATSLPPASPTTNDEREQKSLEDVPEDVLIGLLSFDICPPRLLSRLACGNKQLRELSKAAWRLYFEQRYRSEAVSYTHLRAHETLMNL